MGKIGLYGKQTAFTEYLYMYYFTITFDLFVPMVLYPPRMSSIHSPSHSITQEDSAELSEEAG